jgi:hypothetical protein
MKFKRMSRCAKDSRTSLLAPADTEVLFYGEQQKLEIDTVAWAVMDPHAAMNVYRNP